MILAPSKNVTTYEISSLNEVRTKQIVMRDILLLARHVCRRIVIIEKIATSYSFTQFCKAAVRCLMTLIDASVCSDCHLPSEMFEPQPSSLNANFVT